MPKGELARFQAFMEGMYIDINSRVNESEDWDIMRERLGTGGKIFLLSSK